LRLSVRLLITLLFALAAGTVRAGFLDQPLFNRVAVPEVESLGGVFAMAQDQQGFLWFAGKNGLARYDGYRVDLFRHNPDDPSSLSSNDIHDLLVDRRGHLWIATLSGGGLNRFDFASQTFVRYKSDPNDPHSIQSQNIYALAEDSRGGLWLATHEAGVLRLDHATGHFAPIPQLEGVAVRDLAIDRFDNIWAATSDRGLYRLHTTRPGVEIYRAQQDQHGNLGDDHLFSLFVDSFGNVWVGTLAGGLSRFDRVRGQFVRHEHLPHQGDSLGSGVVWDIAEDSAGNLWVATGDGALNRYNKWSNRFERFYPEEFSQQGLSGVVVSIFLDAAGDLWFGTYNSAVNRFSERGPQFQVLHHRPGDNNSLLSSSILALAESPSGLIWAASDRGLSRFNPADGKFDHWLQDPAVPGSLPGAPLRALAVDGRDRVWVGTAGKGAWWLEEGGFRQLPSELLQDDKVWAICPDSRGLVWIGTQSGGLTAYDPIFGTSTSYRENPAFPNSISHDFVWALMEDREGQLWVGTQLGLNRLQRESGTFVHYLHEPRNPKSLSDNSVRALAQDGEGNIWVGTASGLNRMAVDSGQFQVFRRKDGLADDNVTGLVVDELGFVWVTTQRGLSRYDPVENRFRNFDRRHGVAGNAHPRKSSALRAASGLLYFGGASGITALNPHRVKNNLFETQVQLTGLLVDNQHIVGKPLLDQSIDLTERLVLPHGHNMFTLEFAALSYLVPEQNQYAYRLLGFDSDWQQADSGNRRATYTNLPTGHYQFQVKAANNDGLWSRHMAQLHIQIRPPWWRTFPVYALLALAASVLGYSLVQGARRRRLRRLQSARQLRELDHVKEHFLTHICREMRVPLDSIAGLLAGLVRPGAEELPPRVHQQLAVVQGHTATLVRLARELEDFAGPPQGDHQSPGRPLELTPLVDTTLSWFRAAAERKSLKLIKNLPDDLPRVIARAASLQQIFYCLLDNAISHTDHGYVEVSALRLPTEEGGPPMVLVQVTDTGVGMTQVQVAELWPRLERRRQQMLPAEVNLDLLRARELVQQQGGELSLTSAPQQGSTFAFTLPVAEG
jgi:two-component system sensor histidine kinase ChiS